MNRIYFAVAATLALGTAACGNGGTAVGCTAESAQAPVVGIVKDQLERAISAKVRGEDGARSVSLSKIRAAIGQLVIAIDDIRTSKEDPNSTKRFCTGTLKVRFDADALADADHTRETAGLNSVSALADAADIERHADSFTTGIEFNVQPTDNGDKVFAETESGNNMFDFAAEVLASGLLRASTEESQRAAAQAEAQQTAEQNAALGEQRAANLASAKTDNQLAAQTIGATWQALAGATRQRLLPQQRAWIAKKNADCKVEAASASIDANDKEIARLNCDTRLTQERLPWLANFREEGGVSTSAGAEPLPSSGDERPNDL
ncbi:lysozyme inhibitor LprI family protein [Sphingomonas ginsenosidivorax]|nr:lysozyme inhibitor LprI family protein [Sphingomonas ginsenosidivorax]